MRSISARAVMDRVGQAGFAFARATSLLRRSCAKLCRKAGGKLEQIQLLLGHALRINNRKISGNGAELVGRG